MTAPRPFFAITANGKHPATRTLMGLELWLAACAKDRPACLPARVYFDDGHTPLHIGDTTTGLVDYRVTPDEVASMLRVNAR